MCLWLIIHGGNAVHHPKLLWKHQAATRMWSCRSVNSERQVPSLNYSKVVDIYNTSIQMPVSWLNHTEHSTDLQVQPSLGVVWDLTRKPRTLWYCSCDPQKNSPSLQYRYYQALTQPSRVPYSFRCFMNESLNFICSEICLKFVLTHTRMHMFNQLKHLLWFNMFVLSCRWMTCRGKLF